MTKVFTSPSLPEAEMLQGILEGRSIPCVLRNRHTSIAAGELPFTDIWPELWVLRDSDADAARLVLDTPMPAASAWRCPQGGEENEGQFTACWNCLEDKPQSEERRQDEDRQPGA